MNFLLLELSDILERVFEDVDKYRPHGIWAAEHVPYPISRGFLGGSTVILSGVVCTAAAFQKTSLRSHLLQNMNSGYA